MKNLIVSPGFTLFKNLVHFGNNFGVKWDQQVLKTAYLPRKEYPKLKFCTGKLSQTET